MPATPIAATLRLCELLECEVDFDAALDELERCDHWHAWTLRAFCRWRLNDVAGARVALEEARPHVFGAGPKDEDRVAFHALVDLGTELFARVTGEADEVREGDARRTLGRLPLGTASRRAQRLIAEAHGAAFAGDHCEARRLYYLGAAEAPGDEDYVPSGWLGLACQTLERSHAATHVAAGYLERFLASYSRLHTEYSRAYHAAEYSVARELYAFSDDPLRVVVGEPWRTRVDLFIAYARQTGRRVPLV